MIFAFPYRDLDGRPWPNCGHQHMTKNPVELMVIEGIRSTILAAGIPDLFVRAGDTIKTTWGCEHNRRLKHREAIITSVNVGLYRWRGTMWYRPALEYLAKVDPGCPASMVLRAIERLDGQKWWAPLTGGMWAPFMFRLEWVSPLHGGIERAEIEEKTESLAGSPT